MAHETIQRTRCTDVRPSVHIDDEVDVYASSYVQEVNLDVVATAIKWDSAGMSIDVEAGPGAMSVRVSIDMRLHDPAGTMTVDDNPRTMQGQTVSASLSLDPADARRLALMLTAMSEGLHGG